MIGLIAPWRKPTSSSPASTGNPPTSALAHLRADERGVAALEFAIIVPMILILYLGGFDAMKLVRAYDKTQVAAKTLADLMAQESTSQPIAQSEVAALLAAAGVVAGSYSGTGFSITVSAIDLATSGSGASQTCCTATVRWSATQGGTLKPCGTVLNQIDDGSTWTYDSFSKRLGTQAPQAVVTPAASPAPAVTNYLTVASVITVDVAYANISLTPVISAFANRTLMQHGYAIPRNVGQVAVAPVPSNSTPVTMTGLASGQTGKICS